jgi:glucosamine kinase
MILIADSGSTKTFWALVGDGQVARQIKTGGINPFFRDSYSISEELRKDLLPFLEAEITEVHFYGAGIINKEKGRVIQNLLFGLFPGAEVETQSDLLAVSRATCGNLPGIACILGTGSNSGLFDGEKIIEQVSPLGFILGDEGSGAVMGRKILGDYFKNSMPPQLRENFRSKYNLTKEEVLEKVYRGERPNLFLAKFTEFLSENLQTDYCSSFVMNEFEAFIVRNILNYTDCRFYPVNVVGSVGFVFQDILKEALAKYSLKCGKILKDPMEGLTRFHSQKKW